MIFVHNAKASSAKGLFVNGSSTTVYVEGVDDKNFWYYRFEMLGYKVAVVDTGGVEALLAHKRQICEDPESAKFIVAQDFDYNKYLNKEEFCHPRIINTYGHSIENSMFCIHNVNRLICNYSRTPDKDYSSEVSEWYNSLLVKLVDVIICDIINQKNDMDIEVLSTSAKFVKKNFELKEDVIASVIKNFDADDIEAIKEEVKNDPRPLNYIIRGHALTYIVLHYIKQKSEKIKEARVNITQDSIYAETCKCANKCADCADNKHLKEQIDAALFSIAS